MPKKQHIEIDGKALSVSNTDKIFYPGDGFTKGDLIAFYSEIAPAILPHLSDRPLTLKRYPDGITGEHFYEKNAPVHTPGWVERFAVPRTEGGSDIHYVLCNDLATLVWVTNLGDIEKHTLLAQAPELSRPTSVVFDLDPGEPAGLLECAEVALHLRDSFAALGLESFVKVSGSKGLHLSVPLNTDVSYEMTQPFAKAMAELLVQQMPKKVVSDMAKNLRKGKVLIDWSQNSDFKTTVCVYAMRAKHATPFISMPVTWEELAKAVKQKKESLLFFSPAQAIKRIQKLGDLFAPVLTLQQELPAAFTQALAAAPAPKLTSWQRHRGSKSGDKSLKEYAAKRDHSITKEPAAPAVVKSQDNKRVLRFVIQKHAASHLHYDWRLEMQGVLRSWAVPKGPPQTPRETRLAMHVEDHPMEYADFEGTIPQGQYGGGTVMVWDQGEYEDITGNPTAAYHQGKMHIVMRGKKLKGEWILLKDKREEGNRWMLIKAGEPIKITAKADDTSAISGRSMQEIADADDRQWQSNRGEGNAVEQPASAAHEAPAFIEPMQCKAVAALPETGGWQFEIKFDGYRCLVVKMDGQVTLFSRNEKSLNARFREVVKAMKKLAGEFCIDGEIVAMDENGKPSFQLLQNSTSKAPPVFFYAFDLLNNNGSSVLNSPIEQRREQLNGLLADAEDPIRLSPILEAPAAELFAAVQKQGLEGVVGKRIGSKYEPGERSGAWIKCRTNREQEFVVGGYVPGASNFDALLVGIYEKKKLLYVAKVLNGFVPRIRAEIFPQLKKLETAQCPFTNLPETKAQRWGEPLTAEKMKECRWVKPKLVCQISFVEWTDATHLRHCTFIAMREDKKATAVVREDGFGEEF
jgi:bifunctional non-homologous end joining protein LigD